MWKKSPATIHQSRSIFSSTAHSTFFYSPCLLSFLLFSFFYSICLLQEHSLTSIPSLFCNPVHINASKPWPKKVETTARTSPQAHDLSSMHAPLFGLRGCLNFFGQPAVVLVNIKHVSVAFGSFLWGEGGVSNTCCVRRGTGKKCANNMRNTHIKMIIITN